MHSSIEEEKHKSEDYYQLLGVRRHASFAEVKKAYRALAQQYHPDRSTPDSVEKFVEITKAYEVLLDPDKRNEYNKLMGYEHADIAPLEDDEPSFENSATSEQSNDDPNEKKKVNINSSLISSEDRWGELRSKMSSDDGYDLKVSHKAALATPSANEEKAAADELTPWGGDEEEGSKQKKKGFIGSLLGNFRSADVSKKRTELKDQFRQELEERLHPKEPTIKTPPKRATAPKRPEEESEEAGSLRTDARIFQFYLSSIELYFGTLRELVVPGSDRGEMRRIKVQLDPGTVPGTIMEVSRGWERFNVRVELRSDFYYALHNGDLLVHVPVTVGEALSGTTVNIPTLDGSAQVKIPSLLPPRTEIRIEGKGAKNADSDPGDLVVYPFIVGPTKTSTMLEEAMHVLASQYIGQPIREALAEPLDKSPYARSWDVSTALAIPAALPEVLSGFSAIVSTGIGSEEIRFRGPWKLEDAQILPKKGRHSESLGGAGDLIVFPEVILPTALSPESFAAVSVIDQHYAQPIRSGMPKRLKPIDDSTKK